MPIELHERLSEFSYGYGVTREIEALLASVGFRTAPFMPSLIHEADLGFDVGFDRPGQPLLVQFKLGQAMKRFHPSPRPILDNPFWRFSLDTAEPDGQYELLLKAEQDGAEVLYVAPKFHDWEPYLRHYERHQILANSLLVTPSAIRGGLISSGQPDGVHRVVYDRHRAYVCSEPARLKVRTPEHLAQNIAVKLDQSTEPLSDALRRIYNGFSNRSILRRKSEFEPQVVSPDDRKVYAIASDTELQYMLRSERFARLFMHARTEDEAIALAVGAEVWAAGAQLLLVSSD